jgi:drug/metabolite transporter (DMT)-like permease
MVERGGGRWRQAAGPIAALLLLCFLWSLGSLRTDLLPQLSFEIGKSAMGAQALQFALAALAAALWSLARRERWPGTWDAAQAALIGLAMLVAPAMLIRLAGSSVTDATRVALFSLTPVVAVVFEPYLGRPDAPQVRGGLIAALLAVVGTLCVFPVDMPRTIGASAAFGAVIVAAGCVGVTNCWAVRVAFSLPQKTFAAFVMIATGTAALVFGVGAAFSDKSVVRIDSLLPAMGWTVAVDLPALLLLFWLMRRMTATRMATRFLIAPLMANAAALALFRPTVGLRAAFGLISIATGAAWILLARESEAETGKTTLHLN